MTDPPERAEYSDAAFDSFPGSSNAHGEGRRAAPQTWLAILALGFIGAVGVLTPVPSLVAAVVAERGHRRGQRHMRQWVLYALACTAIGVWTFVTIWR